MEGEEGEEGHSCDQFEELQWELHVDTVMGLIYSTNRSVIQYRPPQNPFRSTLDKVASFMGGKALHCNIVVHVLFWLD